jgi:hypothetical protein
MIAFIDDHCEALVPEGADFPGSVTPTLLPAVVGLHSANPYAQPVGDSVMAVTDGGMS